MSEPQGNNTKKYLVKIRKYSLVKIYFCNFWTETKIMSFFFIDIDLSNDFSETLSRVLSWQIFSIKPFNWSFKMLFYNKFTIPSVSIYCWKIKHSCKYRMCILRFYLGILFFGEHSGNTICPLVSWVPDKIWLEFFPLTSSWLFNPFNAHLIVLETGKCNRHHRNVSKTCCFVSAIKCTDF